MRIQCSAPAVLALPAFHRRVGIGRVRLAQAAALLIAASLLAGPALAQEKKAEGNAVERTAKKAADATERTAKRAAGAVERTAKKVDKSLNNAAEKTENWVKEKTK